VPGWTPVRRSRRQDAGSGRIKISELLIGLGVAAAGLRTPFAEREPVTDARVRAPGSVGALLSLLLACVACASGAGDGRWAGEPLRGQAVDLAGLWAGPDQAKLESALVRFEQETGVTVRYTAMGPGMTAALATRITEGAPPDVAILGSRASLVDLARRGALRPLGEQVEDLVRDNFAPAWRDQGSVEGTLFGVWVKAVNKSTIWYNASSLREAGVNPPLTWDEFLTGARALASAGITPVSIAGGDGWPLTDWFENVYLRMAGPERYDQLSDHAIAWTDKSVKAALSLLGELWGDRTLIVDGAATTDVATSVEQINQTPPKGAIAYGGGWTAGASEEARLSTFPSIDGKNAVVGNGDVAVRLTDDAAAVALMEFLASPKFGDGLAGFGFLSPNRKVNLGFYPDDATLRSARALVEADTFRFDLSDLQPAAFGGTPGQGMWRILQDFLADPSDVEGTARQLEAAAAEAFDR
jgi:alpha-glucoside transport system substrate-binding protein